MRILILLPSLSIGGMERVAVTVANGLAHRGHELTVATYSPADDLASDLDQTIRFLKKGLKPHPIMRRIPWIRHKYYDDGMWEKRTSPHNLHKYYTSDGPYDVEIGFFRGLSIKAISGYPARDGVRTKHIAWVHSDFRRCGGYNYEFRDIEAVREAYLRFDKVVCVSGEASEGFKDVIGITENITTIYNPLPVEAITSKSLKDYDNPFQGAIKEDNQSALNVVIVAHLIDGIKGQCRLIDAIVQLRSKGIKINLTIIGGGDDYSLINKHIAESRANDYVKMVGNQRNPYPFIRQADLLVCASYYEGYNLTVGEALILGTPVMSTRCTGPTEILEDGRYGLLVENSTEGLINGLRKLATQPDLLNHYREKAKDRSPFFDQNTILDQIESLFT